MQRTKYFPPLADTSFYSRLAAVHSAAIPIWILDSRIFVRAVPLVDVRILLLTLIYQFRASDSLQGTRVPF